MPRTPDLFLTRRALIALAAGAATAGAPLAARAKSGRVVTILGDSITAGLGLPASEALPARLEAALAAAGAPARVRGAGVSGDTSAGGLERVDFSVQADTDVCVVALGGNDLLQGLDPKSTRANLERIVRRLKARRIGVVLAGLSAPTAIGAAYAREFDAVFPAVARAEGVPLYPNLLAGVGQTAGLNQRDGIHPNARGVQIIAARLAPVVARALKARA
jgi:acyl-CoA thioesterase-1